MDTKNLEIGKVYSHAAYPDLRAKVVGFKNEKSVNVKVLAGWCGPKIPIWAVSIPKDRLVEVQK